MRLTEISYSDAQPIDGYGPGFVRIGGVVHHGNVLTGPAGTAQWGGYEDINGIATLAAYVDVLFVGTGAEIAQAPTSFRTSLEKLGIGVELMNTPSACRTYNVLLSEGRRVALALFPVVTPARK